jgi:hypothetical protein
MEDYSYTVDLDSIDWDEKINYYLNNHNYGLDRSIPGLMYINWVVSKEFDFDPIEVRSNTRVRRVTKVKHTAMYLAVTLFKYEYSALMDFYNINNHASIVNALEVARNYLFTEKEYKRRIEILTDKLLGYGANTSEIIERSDTEIRT